MCGKDRRVPCVLFADDNPDILRLLAVYAEGRGWRYQTARSAEEMLERINVHCAETDTCFDLVVGDLCYQSPGRTLDGLSALREIRKKFRDLPFIFLSAYMEALTETEAKRLGAYVQEKPIHPEAFFDRLQHIVDMTKGGYKGPERRRRALNLTDHMRRREDLIQTADDLKVPEVLAEAHMQLSAGRKGD